jgi:hypothetical protein
MQRLELVRLAAVVHLVELWLLVVLLAFLIKVVVVVVELPLTVQL